ncbi:MAG: hypothetical protein ACOVMG_07765 [Flavobacterium sp.]
MQKIILYTIVIVFSFLSKVVAQENRKDKIEERKEKVKERKEPFLNKLLSFEKKVELISTAMEFSLAREKNELKIKIDSLETIFKQNKISEQEFKDLKLKEAEKSANRIELEMEFYRVNMDSLIQKKVETDSKEVTFKIDTINGKKVYTYSKVTNGKHYDIPAFKIYKSDHDKEEKKSRRTTSQFVFAFGLNNVITDGENLEDSDYRVWGSHFYEWGISYNSRIFKNNNLLHAKYGLSLMYNNLRPTDNRYFVKNGNQTDLVTSSVNLDESRFRNVYLTAPLHLEFDFTPKKLSKDGTKTYFRTHESIRIGIGGYAGVRIKSKQILKYEADDIKVKEKQKGDFNVSDFNYGLSAYLGYGQTSLYVKYDLNPMFKHNNIDQNNVSLGIRFDFN